TQLFEPAFALLKDVASQQILPRLAL
ncbi:MAG: hypothetical protein QOH92_2982, partial [Chloroflexota bacterium]|nr:hypothetical protein [Chloroflexota bacterium]